MAIPDLVFNNPLRPEQFDAVLELLNLAPEDTVLDVGCGEGALLERVLTRFPCRAVAVDLDASAIDAARERLGAAAKRVTWHACAAQEMPVPAQPLAGAFCIGSTHAYGGPGQAFEATCQTLQRWVRPGGGLLIGEGYWRKPPESGYLEATGMGAGDFVSHAENVERAEALGLRPLYATTASQQAWDHFESLFWRGAELGLQANPEDEAAKKRVAHWRSWRKAYLKWGRDTLGFGLYLFAV